MSEVWRWIKFFLIAPFLLLLVFIFLPIEIFMYFKTGEQFDSGGNKFCIYLTRWAEK